jgi:hypothetical protein
MLTRKHNPPKKEQNKRVITKCKEIQQREYNKWLEMREKIREDQIRPNTQIKAIADFLQKVLPQQQQQNKKVTFQSQQQQHSDGENHSASRKRRRLSFAPSPEAVFEWIPSTFSSLPPLQDVFYETPKRTSAEIPHDDDDADVSPEIEEKVSEFGTEIFRRHSQSLPDTLSL